LLKVVEPELVSVLPITTELETGVKEVTVAVFEPPLELPVDVSNPDAVTPLSSYTETEPVTAEPKDAVTVSEPEERAVPNQTYE